jgi:hypothetical protein
MIYPTPGRIVWYHPAPNAAYPKQGGQPQAAIIAAVLEDVELINLTVCAPSGDTYAARNVILLRDGQCAPADRDYAEWMPYQKGQAAKTEQLAQQLAEKPPLAPQDPAPAQQELPPPPPPTPQPEPAPAQQAATEPAPAEPAPAPSAQ